MAKRKAGKKKSKAPEPFPKPLLNHTHRKERLCLSCSKMFSSLGPANRICSKCQRRLKKVREPSYHKTTIGELDIGE